MLEENINVIFERIKTDEKFDLFQVALKTKTSIIAREYLKSINNKLFVSSILLCESQKKRNKIFEQAIENFVINCNEYGVEPIFFKGLILAYDLFAGKSSYEELFGREKLRIMLYNIYEYDKIEKLL